MNGNHERIALLKFVTDFRIGGTERQVANLATHLDRDRFDLHVACFRQIGDFLGEVRASGAPVTDYVIRSLLGFSVVRQQARLARYLRANRIRIVHTWGFYPNVFAIPAARLAGVRLILASIRDTGDHLPPSRRRLQQWVCRLADRVLVNAVAVKERLISEGCAAEKMTVIPNGIDLRRFSRRPGDRRIRDEFGLPDSAPIVAVVSRLNELKGIEYFLEAARLVSQSFPETRFVLVGDGVGRNERVNGPYRESLKRLSASLGLSRRIVFAGLRSDVPELLAGVTVSVLPSLTEGLSNTILESLATSVPVVATNVGGNPEIVVDGSTGLLVPPRDAAALAGAISALLSNPARATRMGEAGRRRVEEHFSLEAMVRKTERLYESLLKDAPSRARRVRNASQARKESYDA